MRRLTSRKEKLALRVSALSDTATQSKLDAFLVKHDYNGDGAKRRKKKSGSTCLQTAGGESKRKNAFTNSSISRTETESEKKAGEEEEGEGKRRVSVPSLDVEDDGGGLEGEENEKENVFQRSKSKVKGRELSSTTPTFSSQPFDQSSAGHLDAPAAPAAAGLQLESSEERLRRKAKLLMEKPKVNLKSSRLSTILGLRGLAPIPRLQSDCIRMKCLRYGFRKSVMLDSRQSGATRYSKGITCIEMDSRGDLFAAGTEDGRMSIYKADKFASSRVSELGGEGSGTDALLTVPTKRMVRRIKWNPRNENEVAVISGFSREVHVYDLTRWTSGSPPTRTLFASPSSGSRPSGAQLSSHIYGSRSGLYHNGIVEIKHLESMGQYVLAAATAGGEMLLWDTRCRIRSERNTFHDSPGGRIATEAGAASTSYTTSLCTMLKQKQDLQSKCSLRKGTSPLVSIMECGNDSGVLHACNAQGEIFSWDTRQRKTRGFYSNGFGASKGNGSGSGAYFHPLREYVKSFSETFTDEGMVDGLTKPRLVGMRSDPLDSRRFSFTLSSGLSGIARISSSGVDVTDVFLETERVIPPHKRPTSFDPRVSRGDEVGDDQGKNMNVLTAEWTLNGSALCCVDANSSNSQIRVFDSTRKTASGASDRAVVAMADSDWQEWGGISCLASHPFTDDLYCGTESGALAIVGAGVRP